MFLKPSDMYSSLKVMKTLLLNTKKCTTTIFRIVWLSGSVQNNCWPLVIFWPILVDVRAFLFIHWYGIHIMSDQNSTVTNQNWFLIIHSEVITIQPDLILQLMSLQISHFVLRLVLQLIPSHESNNSCSLVLSSPTSNIYSNLIFTVQKRWWSRWSH